MLYTGERNYGCRFCEITYMGLRGLVLENEKLHVVFLLDKGTDIIEMNYKPTDTDFVWKNPMGLSCLRRAALGRMDGDCLSDNYPGCWFEIFPNVGSECRFRGKHFPTHSEVSYLPWEYHVESDSPECVQLTFFVETSKAPFRLEKTVTIESGKPVLAFTEKIRNVGDVSFEYQWGWHPSVGKPFLDENCRVDLPQSAVPVDGKASGRTIAVPRPGTDGNTIRHYENREGWGAIRNTGTGLGIAFAWDAAAAGRTALWLDSGSGKGHIHFGGGYVCCILPNNCDYFSLAASAEKGHPAVLNAGEEKEFYYTCSVFEKAGDRPVGSVTRAGTVTLGG